VILGYQIANRTIGGDWIARRRHRPDGEVEDYAPRSVSLDTPDGTLPLPSIAGAGQLIRCSRSEPPEGAARLDQLFSTMGAQREPPGFFDPAHAIPRDGAGQQVARVRASFTSIYPVARSGQYWLNISSRRVSCACHSASTEQEEGRLGKNFGDIKQVDATFRKKK
jgi:hypothetical protein